MATAIHETELKYDAPPGTLLPDLPDLPDLGELPYVASQSASRTVKLDAMYYDTAAYDLARAGLDTVAVRVPRHPMAREVLGAFSGPVVAPSANRSGRPSPTTFADAVEETGDRAAVALDGGPCEVGLESTVVACLPGEAVAWLRPGSVTRDEIAAVVGELREGTAHAERSPGRLAAHYAPDAPVRLGGEAAEGEVMIGFGPSDGRFNLSPSGDLAEAAANLFALLRAADRLKPSAIVVAPVPDGGLGEAINDRLRRAAGFVG